MKLGKSWILIACAWAGSLAAVSFAQTAPPPPPPPPTADPARGVDPRAEQVLREMSDHLQKLDSFRYSCEAVADVIEAGEKLEYTSRVTLEMARPDRIYAEVDGDLANKRYWYDGRSVTILDRSRNLYSRVAVPATVDAMLDHMAERYGLAMQTADLLTSDVFASFMGGVDSGRYLGIHRVGGHDCHHLAFRQESLDWQIWVDQGPEPWPRRLVITNKLDPLAPQYSATFREWSAVSEFPGDRFEFTAPAEAAEIEMLPLP